MWQLEQRILIDDWWLSWRLGTWSHSQAVVLKKIEGLWQQSKEERRLESTGFRLCTLDMAAATLPELKAFYSSLTGQQSEGTEQSLREQLLPEALLRSIPKPETK